MKRFFAAALACALAAAALAGCGPAAEREPERALKIGFSQYDEYDVFIGLLTDSFMDAAARRGAELGCRIDVVVEAANGNQYRQNSQVEAFIESGCDVICVNIVDRTDATLIIDKAVAAGIPLVFFNREVVSKDLQRGKDIYYVGAPALQSGELQGGIVAAACARGFADIDKNGDGILQYVMLEGQAGHQDATLRTESSVATLADAGYSTEKLEDSIANWERVQAETQMEQWIEAHDNIEVVFSNNDEMALGAIDALKRSELYRGAGAWPLVVGIDGTPAGLAAVKDGMMAGTVFNDAATQADAILALALSCGIGEPLPDAFAPDADKAVRVPYRQVTPENVDAFIALYERKD